jgi:hypothetical protein
VGLDRAEAKTEQEMDESYWGMKKEVPVAAGEELAEA